MNGTNKAPSRDRFGQVRPEDTNSPARFPGFLFVDARERDFKQAERWSDENVFSNRAYFMPEKQPAELGVDHIRESDAGIYRLEGFLVGTGNDGVMSPPPDSNNVLKVTPRSRWRPLCPGGVKLALYGTVVVD
ncbi:unnamed protein product [Nesidiocoris tenuis]|uniref:Uncharacterized protein n=1 Tax=Nesidiocoris tenuis TaxID=355587 RepID=A0A6H5H159_9HEMI|nr:unnamed protein product [Nesidiocoris tenuis]